MTNMNRRAGLTPLLQKKILCVETLLCVSAFSLPFKQKTKKVIPWSEQTLTTCSRAGNVFGSRAVFISFMLTDFLGKI